VSLQLSSAPVNGLSLSLCSQLISTLKELEEDSSVRGLIIGSAVNGIFSAGLDIKSLILTPDYTEEDLCQFWNTVQEKFLIVVLLSMKTSVILRLCSL